MIEVLKSGIQTTLQSIPRTSGLSQGIARGGAADQQALFLVNALLDQSLDCATLEVTRSPVAFRFLLDVSIAISGAGIDWYIDEEELPLQTNRVYTLKTNQQLKGSPSNTGFRSYLGIKGGFKAELFAGSKSTDLNIGQGGSQKALKNGEVIFLDQDIEEVELNKRMRWFLNAEWSSYQNQQSFRVFAGPEYALFPEDELSAFLNTDWNVHSDTNRMGLRLESKSTKNWSFPTQQMYSATVLPGTVQLTQSGPIILFSDAHTAGGYPRIFQLCEVDLAALAQKSPGDQIRFERITLSDAIAIKKELEKKKRQLLTAIRFKYA